MEVCAANPHAVDPDQGVSGRGFGGWVGLGADEMFRLLEDDGFHVPEARVEGTIVKRRERSFSATPLWCCLVILPSLRTPAPRALEVA